MEYLPQDTILIGLEYGGIELPFTVNAYRSLIGKSKLQTLSVNLSSYSVSNKAFVDYLEDACSPLANMTNLSKYTTALILDDSTTTGRTIEYLAKLLPKNITNVYLALVSFTNTNRFHHLARHEHGGINPLVAENAVIIFKSNYTQTYTKHSYTDRRGVFDKNKSKIIKMLHKHYLEYL